MDGLQTALNVLRPTAEEPSSLPWAALFVACRSFPGPSHLVQRVPDAMARDSKMLGGFRLASTILNTINYPLVANPMNISCSSF